MGFSKFSTKFDFLPDIVIVKQTNTKYTFLLKKYSATQIK